MQLVKRRSHDSCPHKNGRFGHRYRHMQKTDNGKGHREKMAVYDLGREKTDSSLHRLQRSNPTHTPVSAFPLERGDVIAVSATWSVVLCSSSPG